MQLACFPISELWGDDGGSEIKWQLISFVQTESIKPCCCQVFQVSLVSSTPVWPFRVPAATWQLCACYCKPLTALLHHVLFEHECHSVQTHRHKLFRTDWLVGRFEIIHFACLFKSPSACEPSRQAWLFSIYTRLPQKYFILLPQDTFFRQVGLTERNVCQKPHRQVVWTSFKMEKKKSFSCFCLNAICQLSNTV